KKAKGSRPLRLIAAIPDTLRDTGFAIDRERKTPKLIVVLKCVAGDFGRALRVQAFTRRSRIVRLFPALRTLALAGPAADFSRVDVKKIQHSRKRVINPLFDRFWLREKCRNWRIDDPARFGHGCHGADVTNVKGRSPQHENQAAALLQNDVR